MRHRVMRLLGRLPVAGRIASGDHGLVSAVSARATVGECDRFVELCERCDKDQNPTEHQAFAAVYEAQSCGSGGGGGGGGPGARGEHAEHSCELDLAKRVPSLWARLEKKAGPIWQACDKMCDPLTCKDYYTLR
ncbi:hypothetical protein AXG93_1774s1230 [Marchantia polymorpha subsp. ruderalis]|uniref:Uncharacterized protein n=1 Tax=Marchantia polymorpha subsp. ruderalis TaxID=1480154 RepID=A0A176W310_MARPO|nr:hypothetical protein AXG93_1774s1230 [Marchantia polymorpha subsp. ruderalis]